MKSYIIGTGFNFLSARMQEMVDLRSEIFHPHPHISDNSQITFKLSTFLRSDLYFPQKIIDYFRDYEIIVKQHWKGVYYTSSRSLRINQIHISTASSRLLVWAFGKVLCPEWSLLFKRVEQLIEILEAQKLYYGAMILHESVAHRYADCMKDTGEYIHMVEYHYNTAYNIAKKLQIIKNMESSMYHAWRAWVSIKDTKRSIKYAKIFLNEPIYFNDSRYRKQECLDFLNSV